MQSKNSEVENVQILMIPATSKATMSAPKCRKIKFDPSLDAPGSEFSSARQTNVLRQTRDPMETFL